MKKVKKVNIIRYIGFLILGFFLTNLIWYILAAILNIQAMPSPVEVYSSYENALNNDIIAHTIASLYRVATGIVISLIIALIIGVTMGYNAKINRFLSPLIYFSYPLPKLAFLPIIMILFGIGDASKIIIIVLIIVFQLTINIRDAIINIPKEDYDLLVSLKASSIQKIRHITLPAILPDIFTSLRVAIGIAMSALFVTETFGTDKGLGFYITDSWMRIDYIQMFFGIVVLSISGIAIFILVDIANRLMCKWKFR